MALKNAPDDIWLDTWEAAQYLGISVAVLRQHLAGRQGPKSERQAGVQGTPHRFRPADLDAWVKARADRMRQRANKQASELEARTRGLSAVARFAKGAAQ